MSNKAKIESCIKWFKIATEQVEDAIALNDWEEAAHVIENWIIKDANEALQILNEGLKDE